MNFWSAYPMVRLVIPFLSGCMTGFLTVPDNGKIIPGAVAFILLITATWLLPVYISKWSLRWIPGFLINFSLFLGGFTLTILQQPGANQNFTGGQYCGMVLAEVTEAPGSKNGVSLVTVDLKYKQLNSEWKPISGKVIASLVNRNHPVNLQTGDFILLNSDIDSVRDNSNPHSFNYARYLYRKGITHRVWCEPHEWLLCGRNSTPGLKRFALQIRNRLLDILKIHDLKGDEFAVAAALLLGYVNDLTPDLLRDYSASGAMHVLSVSGMHVGVIYLFIEFLLGFMNKKRWSRWLKAFMVLSLIWFYACMTGLSPCVVRSAIMITLPVIAKTLNKNSDMINVISTSLFLMVAINPMVLFDIGFQLSYLAVTGLVVLYKPIYDLYVTSRWIPDKIWSLWAVSISAQIATLPLTLYVFHQFPNYFLLTNLVVVPLSSLIIYAGILLLGFSFVPQFAWLLSKVFIFLIRVMNHSIHFIEQLPMSTVQGIFISGMTMILLFLLIIMIYQFSTTKRVLYFAGSLSLIIVMLIISIANISESGQVRSMTVFNIRKSSFILFREGDRAMAFYGTIGQDGRFVINRNRKMIQDNLAGEGIRFCRFYHDSFKGIKEIDGKSFIPLLRKGNLVQFGDKRIVILSEKIPKGFSAALKSDYLIISRNPKISIPDINRIFHPGLIIIDGSNTRGRVKKWKTECEKERTAVFIVGEEGAYVSQF